MGLLDQAKSDIEEITSNLDEWAAIITFTAPTGEIAIVNGLHRKIHLGVDTDGNVVDSKQAHVSVSERFLTEALYPVRGAKGEIVMYGHLINVKDSTGIIKNYIAQTIIPDETIGLITILLGDYKP